MNPSLRRRLGSAAIYLPIVLALVWLHPFAYAALLLACAILGGWELCGILEGMGWRAPRVLPLVAAAVFVSALWGWLGPVRTPLTILTWLGGLAWLFFPVMPAGPRRGATAALVHLLGALYLGLLLAALGELQGTPVAGSPHVDAVSRRALFALAVVWSCDTGAYAVGTVIGRHRLWPAVSPKKSWEGFWGGLAFSTVVAAVLVGPMLPGVGPVAGALLGLVAGLAAQAGDLVESRLKRMAGVKDASALIPGHGGVLDRLDSLIFAAPVFSLGLKLLQP